MSSHADRGTVPSPSGDVASDPDGTSLPTGGQGDATAESSHLPGVDRVLYALFARHADRPRHEGDRSAYRGTDLKTSFGVYVARLYGLSWVAFLVTTAAVGLATAVAAPEWTATVANRLPIRGTSVVAAVVGVAGGLVAKRGTVLLGGRYLRWRAAARRVDIERTLPGAVRYLRVLSTGTDDLRGMLRKVADNRDAYGHTAVAFRTALNKAALTGSLGEGLRIVARDTPSRDALAPFLLKFREHAAQGEEELASYLRMESRMLSHQRSRARARRQDFMELLAELFIVLLVLPALLVIVVSVLSVLSTGLSRPIATPVGPVSVRAVLIYGSAALVVVVGVATAVTVDHFRPPGQTRSYERPEGVVDTLATATTNPASAVAVAVPPALAVGVGAWRFGVGLANAALLTYATWAVPVGIVAVRRERIDDAKDREIKDFVHAVAGHVSLGRPFSEAVEIVAREVDLGPLNEDVADLAFNAGLTTRDEDLRSDALDRFVERVGTPLAEQTVGLVRGALDAGGDADDVFDAIQTEVGRLYHEKRTLQSAMQVYVVVGWTTALLILGIAIAVNAYVIDGFDQLSAVAAADEAIAFNADGIDLEATQFRFYVVVQATMLACGWFAGAASRGRYEALLHSGALVLVAYAVFLGVGMA